MCRTEINKRRAKSSAQSNSTNTSTIRAIALSREGFSFSSVNKAVLFLFFLASSFFLVFLLLNHLHGDVHPSLLIQRPTIGLKGDAGGCCFRDYGHQLLAGHETLLLKNVLRFL